MNCAVREEFLEKQLSKYNKQDQGLALIFVADKQIIRVVTTSGNNCRARIGPHHQFLDDSTKSPKATANVNRPERV